jgi:hypothetical protein
LGGTEDRGRTAPGGNGRAASERGTRAAGWSRQLARLVLVESMHAAFRWIAGAAAAALASASSWLLDAPPLVQGVLLGACAVMLVPPAVGLRLLLSRSTRLGREVCVMEAQRDKARARVVRLHNQIDGLRRELEQVRGRCEALEADREQSERTDSVLGDWLLTLLIDPYPVRAENPGQSFEDLLARTSRKVLPVLFPGNELVPVAVVRQEYEDGDFLFEITHRGPGVPDRILDLSPARSRYDFRTCLGRHAPEAVSFDFVCASARHWVVAFPERPPLHPVKRAPLMAVAAMLASIFTALPRET